MGRVEGSPCRRCGKAPRCDYNGICMDCADELGVSEMFHDDPKYEQNLEKAKVWLATPPPTGKPEKVIIMKRRLYNYVKGTSREVWIAVSEGGFPYSNREHVSKNRLYKKRKKL